MATKEKKMVTERKKKLEKDSFDVCKRIKSVFEKMASLHNFVIIHDQIDFDTYHNICVLLSELKVTIARMECEIRVKPYGFIEEEEK